MNHQLRLFDDEKKPRAKPRKLMHVIDAGPGDIAEGGHMVRMQCSHCNHETDWFWIQTVTEGKRGKPCPMCNQTGP